MLKVLSILSSTVEFVRDALGKRIYRPRSKKSNNFNFPIISLISVVSFSENGFVWNRWVIVHNDGYQASKRFLARSFAARSRWCSLPDSEIGCHKILTPIFRVKRLDQMLRSLINEIPRNATGKLYRVYSVYWSNFTKSVVLFSVSKNAVSVLMFHDRADGRIKYHARIYRRNARRSSSGGLQIRGKLQDEGLINYNRGKINILDRTGLLEVSCECYRAFVKFLVTFASDLSIIKHYFE